VRQSRKKRLQRLAWLPARRTEQPLGDWSIDLTYPLSADVPRIGSNLAHPMPPELGGVHLIR